MNKLQLIGALVVLQYVFAIGSGEGNACPVLDATKGGALIQKGSNFAVVRDLVEDVPTMGIPIAPQATVNMVEIEIAGSYKRTKTENFEQFLDKLGTSFGIKKFLTINTPRLNIESVNGNEWRTTFSMGTKTTPFQFAFNTPVNKQTTWYFKTGTTKVVQEGDNKWVFFIEGEDNIDVKETWVFADAFISIEYMSGDVVTKQRFSKQ